jgi:hypothetical protein
VRICCLHERRSWDLMKELFGKMKNDIIGGRC